jgi:hypothetical protein
LLLQAILLLLTATPEAHALTGVQKQAFGRAKQDARRGLALVSRAGHSTPRHKTGSVT